MKGIILKDNNGGDSCKGCLFDHSVGFCNNELIIKAIGDCEENKIYTVSEVAVKELK